MVTAITVETDSVAFNIGIGMWGADIIGPVAIYPQRDFQEAPHVGEEVNMAKGIWSSHIGVAGVGQYSLSRKRPAIAFGRIDVYFREPTEEEIRHDVRMLGEQVVDEPTEEDREKGYRRLEGGIDDGLKYTGPERVLRTVVTTRVCEGEAPDAVQSLWGEIKGLSRESRMIVPQSYHLFAASGGRVVQYAFGEPENYDRSKSHAMGHVEIEDRKMTFFPNSDRTHPIDFTGLLWRD